MKRILISLIISFFFTNAYSNSKFDKDHFNSPNDYSLFKSINSVKFVNLTNSGCKKAEPTNNYHGITLTKCYAEYEKKNKNLIKYLNGIF